MFDDIMSGDIEHVLDKRKIRKWNKSNSNKFKMGGEERMGCNGNSTGYMPKNCGFRAELTNNTKEYIAYVVVNIKIFNKVTTVVQAKETFSVSVVPTVTQKIEILFNNDLLEAAYKQLGDNYSWNYELVGCVPKNMAFGYSDDYNWLE
jgi:hypothetical protein